MSNEITNRRRQLSEFRDLFTALFKIPDKDVQNRVLNAVNGIIDGNCKCKVQKFSVATQTDEVDEIIKENKIKIDEYSDNSLNNTIDFGDREIRKRKKAKRIPRVVKSEESFDWQSDVHLKQDLDEKNSTIKASIKVDNFNFIPALMEEYSLSDLTDCPKSIQDITKQDVVNKMKAEWDDSLNFVNGYLPIHRAVIQNEIKKFKRQVYVFKYRKMNIFNLYTENHESLLQLAIKQNSMPSIVRELITNGADPNEIDANGNTIVHLAIKFTDDIGIFETLLECIHFEILIKTNDTGLSALHLAAIENKFEFCKTLLKYINSKLEIKNKEPQTNDENILIDFYKQNLTNLGSQKCLKINKKKKIIINQIDRKHGRTPLFFALQMKSKLMVFMLLYHLADPCIRDYSGMDCQTFVADYYDNPQILSALIHTACYLERCRLIQKNSKN